MPSALFSPQLIFVDAMKHAGEWMVQKTDLADWSLDSVSIPDRPDGYPTHVPFAQGSDSFVVHTIMFWNLPNLYPSGTYMLKFKGKGQVNLTNDPGNLTFTDPDSAHSFTIASPSNEGINLTILSSDSLDPIRQIEIIMPGYETTYQTQIFHPRFLEFIAPWECLRFMNPQKIVDSRVVTWQEQARADHYTQADEPAGGLAPDYLIKICNQGQKNGWFNIPFAADDNYVTQFARLLRDSMSANLKIYIEYGNENWTDGFRNKI